jgi:hypothetical protein
VERSQWRSPDCLSASVASFCPTHELSSLRRCHNATHRADPSTDSPPKKVSCQAGDLASGGSGSLGQVGASAKEVSHKAEAEIPGNAASIHAEGRNGGGLLARKTKPLRFKGVWGRGAAESRRL